jgi:hypothetical protein
MAQEGKHPTPKFAKSHRAIVFSINGKEFKGSLISCRRLAVYEE